MTADPTAVTAADGPAGTPSSPTQTVGKYRLDRVLGTGGMGVVWAAFDPDLERSVALKLLRVEATEATMRTRLLREARAMARLRHPNVVTVFEVGTDQGRDYIAMELVEGGTLDDWLKTKPARSAIVDALVAAGRGLAAAHNAGLVHRDFKPYNVLRANDGHIYVTDFGLARGQIEEGPTPVPVALPIDPSTSSQPRDFLDSTLTQTGVLIGTPAYMAPEQFGGGTPGPKSDQFAFCVTAWQALTGERPFRGTNVKEIEEAARGGARALVADLPPAVRAVLERGLDPAPEARWPDMPSLLSAFTGAFDTKPVVRRRKWLVPAIAGAVLAIGGATTFVVTRKSVAKDDCAAPQTAFDPAWGAKRKSEFRGLRVKDTAGTLYLLEEIRKRWTKSYTAACKAPRTEETKERIQCLREIRDEIAKAPLAQLDTGEVGAMMGALGGCDPSTLRDWNFGVDVPDPPDLPGVPE